MPPHVPALSQKVADQQGLLVGVHARTTKGARPNPTTRSGRPPGRHADPPPRRHAERAVYGSLRMTSADAGPWLEPGEEGEGAAGEEGRRLGVVRRQRAVGEQVLVARVDEELDPVGLLDQGS